MADKFGAATPVMGSVGLSWLDVKAFAAHLIHLLQTEGDTAIDVVDTGMKLVKAVTGGDYLGIFAALQKEEKDIQEIIAAVKAEFNL